MSSELDTGSELGIDLPRKPAYRDVDRQNLDDSLQDAVRLAEKVGNDYLARVLKAELGCARLDATEQEAEA